MEANLEGRRLPLGGGPPLGAATSSFLADQGRNRYNNGRLEVSSLFKWYGEDLLWQTELDNTKESLLNPHFFVFGDNSVDWMSYLND